MMKHSLFALALLVLLSGFTTPRDDYPKNPNIDALNYTFRMTLQDDTDQIQGETTVDLRFLAAGMTEVRLDLIKATDALEGKGMRVRSVTSTAGAVTYRHDEEALFITLATPSEANQRTQITIRYEGIPATGLKIGPNKYGDRTFFSDNWPNRARHWLPTIDHPYDKATNEFIVTAPDHYQVISNGLLQEETDKGDGTRLTHWKQSVPIASWLYVLGVARFAVQYVDTYDGKSIQTWVYHQDRDPGFYDFAVPTKHALEYYSDWVGPFAYEKLANIQSNSVGGGMEAATAIFYGDNSVTGERSVRWRNVIIHEIAHQWFGNAVTEYDWDDVWLSEGFATYFTLLFIEHAYGREAFVEGLRSAKGRIDRFTAENPDYRIIHDNLSDMRRVTSSQTYQKGAWTLHMLRGLIGTDAFWQGIQTYYQEFMNKNATTADFQRHMEEASGQPLGAFLDQWLRQGGALKVAGDWHYADGTLTITLNQVQTDGYRFEMPIQVGIYTEGQATPHIEVVQLSQDQHTYTLSVDAAPHDVRLDPYLWVLMDVDFSKR